MFVTWQVENSFTKSQIMELYLNVIEFGPGIYGLKQAARYYFGKTADMLSPLEAVFLASLIPNPKRYHHQFARGEVSDRWRRHLRWIMGVMVERGKLTADEFADAAPYSPRFRSAEVDVSAQDDSADDDTPPLPEGFPPIPDDIGPATGDYN